MRCQHCNTLLRINAGICPKCGANRSLPATGPTQRLFFSRLSMRSNAPSDDLTGLRRVVAGHLAFSWRIRLIWIGANITAIACGFGLVASMLMIHTWQSLPKIVDDLAGLLVWLIFVLVITSPVILISRLWLDQTLHRNALRLIDTIVGTFLGSISAYGEIAILYNYITYHVDLSYFIFNQMLFASWLAPVWLLIVVRRPPQANIRWLFSTGIASICAIGVSWYIQSSYLAQLSTIVAAILTGALCGCIYACLTAGLLPWAIQGQPAE